MEQIEIPAALQVPSELQRLLRFAAGKKLILEIGTAMGGTLFHLMQVAHPKAEIVSIDLPGGPFGGEHPQPTIEQMDSWKKPNQLLRVLRGDSHSAEIYNRVKEILRGRKFDFMLIDGDHTYEGVKADFETYREFAGDVVAFHDICFHTQADIGVGQFWKELGGDKQEIIDDRHQGWAGIGVYRVHRWKALDALYGIYRQLSHPIATTERILEGYYVWLHGRGAAHQEFFYRCHTCGRVITWNKIRSGKTCCAGKVVTTDLRFQEVLRLLLIPWSV